MSYEKKHFNTPCVGLSVYMRSSQYIIAIYSSKTIFRAVKLFTKTDEYFTKTLQNILAHSIAQWKYFKITVKINISLEKTKNLLFLHCFSYSWQKNGFVKVWVLGACIKGTQDWEFFWLRIWILYHFIVSYAQILRFCKKVF